VKERGFATVRRASDSELLKDLRAEGDLPGALWKQGLFDGVGLWVESYFCSMNAPWRLCSTDSYRDCSLTYPSCVCPTKASAISNWASPASYGHGKSRGCGSWSSVITWWWLLPQAQSCSLSTV